MNPTTLGALRGIGYLILFAIISTLIGLIPDVLTQLPYVGGLVTPVISAAIVAFAAGWEHNFAAQVGYSLPAGSTRRN
jgi:prepilin signal peptidase PulO-like enzyme (type II secretory pathway)